MPSSASSTSLSFPLTPLPSSITSALQSITVLPKINPVSLSCSRLCTTGHTIPAVRGWILVEETVSKPEVTIWVPFPPKVQDLL